MAVATAWRLTTSWASSLVSTRRTPANRRGHSHDPKANAALEFARTLVEKRGGVTEQDVQQVKEAGFDDGEVAEIIAHVALNILTNYFNVAVETPIDFPVVGPLPA